MKKTIGKYIPLIESLKDYTPTKSKEDLIAGLLVGIMLVPQAMGYAMLAGLPPVVGLYASTIPLVVYALLGTSRHLAIGPVAIVSLLVFANCSQLAEPGSLEYIRLALVMAGLSGLILLFLGLIRAGFLINFISDSVIHGFTSAAAIIIAVSQLPHICGIKVSGSGPPIIKIVEVITKLPDFHFVTLSIGIGCLVILGFSNRFLPRGIGPFVVVILSTLLVFLLRTDKTGLIIVGAIPQGLPSIGIPGIKLDDVKLLLPGAVSIAFIGYIESMAVSKLIASRSGYTIDPDKELTALGLSSIIASIFSGYPVTGGFSRSAVNSDAGAHTNVSSIVTALVVILTLVFLTPLFYFMPKAALSAIVIISVIKLVDLREGFQLYKIQKADGLAFLITFLATLGLGVEDGILTGLVFSLGMHLWRSSHPYIAELGYVSEENIFRDVKYVKKALKVDSMLFLRVEGPLFFADLKFMEDNINIFIRNRKPLKQIVIDMSGISFMDAVAVKRLEKLIAEYSHRGIETLFSRSHHEVRETLIRAGWDKKQLMNRCYPSNIELFHKFKRENR